MDIVLGVSMTPTTVRMVLVEGEKGDGLTVDHDAFDIASGDASATASEQVVTAILGTRESAAEGGHRLVATGVAWRDHDEAAALRDALAAYVGHGRKVSGARRGRRSSAASSTGHSAKEIRDWARSHGHDVPERGRIPATVREAFETAH